MSYKDNFKDFKFRPVFPLIPKQKRPVETGWQKGNNYTDIDWIFKAFPSTTSLGFCTGAISGIMVLDIDVKHGKDGHANWLRLLDSLDLDYDEWDIIENAYKVHTVNGDGYQLYFEYQPGLRGVADIPLEWAPKDSGIDIRTDGNFVVAPGSTIVKDAGGEGIYRISDENEGIISPLPQKVFNFLKTQINKPKVNTAGDGPKCEFYQVVTEGSRDDTLFRYSCHLRAKGIDDPWELLQLGLMYNEKYFVPPLTEEEVKQKVTSALSYKEEPYYSGADKLIDIGALVLHFVEQYKATYKDGTVHIQGTKGKLVPMKEEDMARYYYKIAKESNNSKNYTKAKAEQFVGTLEAYVRYNSR